MLQASVAGAQVSRSPQVARCRFDTDATPANAGGVVQAPAAVACAQALFVDSHALVETYERTTNE